MFFVTFSDKANRFLKKLDKHIAFRIIDKLESLKENPVPSDAVFIGRENEGIRTNNADTKDNAGDKQEVSGNRDCNF